MKKSNKSVKSTLALLLAICLTLPLGLSTFAAAAETPAEKPTIATTFRGIPLPADGEEVILLESEPLEQPKQPPLVTEDFAESSRVRYADEEDTPPAFTGPVNRSNPYGAMKSGAGAGGILYAASARTDADPAFNIDAVEVINGGSVQATYRADKVTQSANGKYYTTARNASFSDPRRFTVSSIIAKGAEEANEIADMGFAAYRPGIAFTYGGKALDEWLGGNRFDSAGNPFISLDSTPALSLVTIDGEPAIKMTATINFNSPYSLSAAADASNRAYTNYPAFTQSTLGTSQGTPHNNLELEAILGTYDLEAVYTPTGKVLGSVPIKLNVYDSFRLNSEIETYALDLKDLSDSNGNIINGRYVKVESIGKSSTGLDMWNVVIADSKNSVDEYLNVTKPMINKKPMALKAELAEGNQKSVLYFNNIHPDEYAGADANVNIVDMLINDDVISYDSINNVTDRLDSADSTKNNGYCAADGTDSTRITFNTADVLDKFIIVTTLTCNPDGREGFNRYNRNGFDLNRDSAYQTQPEAVSLTSNIIKWDPLVMAEFHGHVTGMLIEPCTGPHDPNYEYDLLYTEMIKQAYAGGKAMIASTSYNRFLIPAVHYTDGWDDGGPMYSPVFAMLFGVLGYTVEIPHVNQDSVDACVTFAKVLMYDSLTRRVEVFGNKLNYKQRGIDNVDDRNVDLFLTDPYVAGFPVVGRPRQDRDNYFPEYYIIPVDDAHQWNPAEAYRTMKLLERNDAFMKQTTEDVIFDGEIYPAGTYIIDMHQSNRGYINSIMSGGYDASSFASMYAEITIDFPDTRGFKTIPVFEEDVFTDKAVDVIVNRPEIIVPATEYAVLTNMSQDMIQLINALLKDGKPVYMIDGYISEGDLGDFIVKSADLEAYKEQYYVDTTPIDALPASARAVPEPKVYLLAGARSQAEFVFKELGFDYIASTSTTVPEDRNVIVSPNNSTNVASAITDRKLPYIGTQRNAIDFASNNLNLGVITTSNTGNSYEAVFKTNFSKTSILTNNYEGADGLYLVGPAYLSDLPAGMKSLVNVIDDVYAIKGGWFRNRIADMRNQPVVFSGLGGPDNDIPVTLFSSNIFNKAHPRAYYPMMAKAIYGGAAGIVDLPKPVVYADPEKQEVRVETPYSVTLTYIADETQGSTATLTKKLYKIDNSPRADAYNPADTSWIEYTTPIDIPNGVSYIHYYAENSLGQSAQGDFGPYGLLKHVTGIKIANPGTGIGVDRYLTLRVTITPPDADCQDLIWTSSNEAVATVENGVVYGVSGGSVIVTATSVDGAVSAKVALKIM